MTQEEKARAYDEALERARQIKNGENGWGYSDLVEITPALEEVFPQLREGEDEKIMKAVVKSAEEWYKDNYGYDNPQGKAVVIDAYVAGAIDWLKKQKEQKPMKWSEEDEIHVRSIFGDFRQDVVPDEEDQDWLKKKLESLRLQPLWKPSEEQMKELKDASVVMKCDSDDNAFPSLKTLYEQLEKL